MTYLKEYAIRLETQKYLNGLKRKSGGCELLENISEISLHECKFEDNGKGDVILKLGMPFVLKKQDELMNMES